MEFNLDLNGVVIKTVSGLHWTSDLYLIYFKWNWLDWCRKLLRNILLQTSSKSNENENWEGIGKGLTRDLKYLRFRTCLILEL